MPSPKANALVGCLLGTAVGDAIGLPCEGLTKRRQRCLYPQLNRHHFLLGKGMVSDDTEHTCMVAQSLIVASGEVETFTNALAWRLCFWLLGVPAGIGYATLKAIVKLWLGFKPPQSGIFSAGNGPAMRSAIIGVCYGHNPQKLRELVRASTWLTHTDPKAEFGALAV
ncbi:MAG TPA: ADP-ribosylglycohydrolase family protein, partial [Coleofasciculaceae cyanobacterium]